MSNTKQLKILINDLKLSARNFEKLAKKDNSTSNSEQSNYGGKGNFSLPKSHKAAMKVPKGGSCCDNCKFVDRVKHSCKNEYYIMWNGGDEKLPDEPLDEICSDWYQPKK